MLFGSTSGTIWAWAVRAERTIGMVSKRAVDMVGQQVVSVRALRATVVSDASGQGTRMEWEASAWGITHVWLGEGGEQAAASPLGSAAKRSSDRPQQGFGSGSRMRQVLTAKIRHLHILAS